MSESKPKQTKRRASTKKASGGRKRHDQADQVRSRCQHCQSTERTAYFNTRTIHVRGLLDGKPFNKVVLRRTACKNCGQHRVDRSHEFDPDLEDPRQAA